MTLHNRPKRMPGIELQPTGPELLVHDTSNAKVHVLNATAGRILTLCDGEHDVDGIVDAIVSDWGIDPTIARTDTERALTHFTELGLIAGAD